MAHHPIAGERAKTAFDVGTVPERSRRRTWHCLESCEQTRPRVKSQAKCVLQNLWDAQQATTRVTRGLAEERG